MVSREHDAEKCEQFSDDIVFYLFDASADSDLRSIRPEIPLAYTRPSPACTSRREWTSGDIGLSDLQCKRRVRMQTQGRNGDCTGVRLSRGRETLCRPISSPTSRRGMSKLSRPTEPALPPP
ncbi:hypothetical protein FP026_28565 [Rhizobium tropici]|uniref:Uncharacterized protein n=1 Tax=Rhizobium tropici TaxID=398 RepID=A0A5B0VMQ5_RHITR|nr:hypothetical protein FP026_28565 [Rhizobium tropici]